MNIIAQVAYSQRLATELKKPAKIVTNAQVWLLKSNPVNVWYENQTTREQVIVRGTSTLQVSHARSRAAARQTCQTIAKALGWAKLRVVGGIA
jgi:hypothetical protein